MTPAGGYHELLTNDEIDALLELFQTEGVPDELTALEGLDHAFGEVRHGDVAPLDLLKPNRFTRDQLLVIERIEEMVARKVGGTIADRLRLDVDCDCVAVEQIRFGSWVGQVEGSIGVWVVELEPLELPAVVTFSCEFLFGVVDRILGGTGEATTARAELTDTEYAVAEAMTTPIVEHLADGISEIVEVRPRVTGRFGNLAMAQALPLQEVVLAVHFQVAGHPLIGDIRFVVPYAALEGHLEKLAKSRFVAAATHAGEFREIVAGSLRSVAVELRAVLGGARLTLRDLLELGVGDIVPLDTKPSDPVVVPVQGRPKFSGRLGTVGRRFAVRIERVLGEDAAQRRAS